MIALYLHLGGACPPHWVFQGFVVLKKKKVSGRNSGWGGGWVVGSPICWLWEQVWNFLALGGPTSSVSRRVVKLTVSHYYSAPLPLPKRGYGDKIRNPVVFMIPSTGSGLGIGGRGINNGCDFWN